MKNNNNIGQELSEFKPVELVGYEDEEAGNSNYEVRSLRLQSWEVHKID